MLKSNAITNDERAKFEYFYTDYIGAKSSNYEESKNIKKRTLSCVWKIQQRGTFVQTYRTIISKGKRSNDCRTCFIRKKILHLRVYYHYKEVVEMQ